MIRESTTLRSTASYDRISQCLRFLATAGLFVCQLTVSYSADIISIWDGSTNDWTSAHWSSPNFPNNGNGGFTYDAAIGGGTVTLDQDIAVENFALSGGELTATSPHALTVNDLFTWTGGTMAGGGQTTVASSGSLAISATGSVPMLSSVLVNIGTATWTSGGFGMNSATFENNGSFTFNSNLLLESMGFGSSASAFNNVGTFIKQGSGTAQFRGIVSHVAFNNSGLVDTQQGTLSLLSGGTHTGDFSLASGATLLLSSSHSFATSSDVNGAGTIKIESGAVTFDGQLPASGTVFVNGGTLDLTSTTTAGTLNLSSGGAIAGTGNITLTGVSTWTNGIMSGSGQTTIASSGSLALGGNAQLNRLLVNEGATTWSTGSLAMGGGTFQNNGSFTANSNSTLDTIGFTVGATNTFNNAGTFTKQGTGAVRFGAFGNSAVVFNNSGSVDVLEGTLSLLGGGTHTGSFSIASEAALLLSSNQSFAASSIIHGAGTLRIQAGVTTSDGQLSSDGIIQIDGGEFVLNSTTTSSVLNLSGNTLSGTGNVTFTGVSTWTNGIMSGSGQTTIASSGSLALGGNAQLNRLLVNEGATTWSTGSLAMGGGTFQNNGSFTANSNSTLDTIGFTVGATNTFNNAGTFTKQGTGAVRFGAFGNSAVVFNNSGSVDVLEGTLSLLGGGTHTGDLYIADGAELRLQGGHVFLGGETYVEQGATLDAVNEPLYIGATSETVFATLTNFGTIENNVIVDHAKLEGAGLIDGSVTLRGGYLRRKQRMEGLVELFEISGDLIVEPSELPWAGNSELVSAIRVYGTTYVRDAFDVKGVLSGQGNNIGSELIIEDGGKVTLFGTGGGSGRLGGNSTPIVVRLEEGGVLEGIGEWERANVNGKLIQNGGKTRGNIKVHSVEFQVDSTNSGTMELPFTLEIPKNVNVDGGAEGGNFIAGGVQGGGGSDNPGALRIPPPPDEEEEEQSSGGASFIAESLNGGGSNGDDDKLVISPGDFVGSFTLTSPASNALTVALPDDPDQALFKFEINDATGAMGMNPGWDTLAVSNGGVALQANPGAGMTIAMSSLLNNDMIGDLENFNPYAPYTWRFIDTALGFSGVAVEDINFVVDDSLFASVNGIPTGRFAVIQDSPLSLALAFAPLLPGDYDFDDEVEADDYHVWKATFGSTSDLRADGNGDGVVNAADYTIWRDWLGATASSASAGATSVPEPAAVFLLIGGSGLFAVSSWRFRLKISM